MHSFHSAMTPAAQEGKRTHLASSFSHLLLPPAHRYRVTVARHYNGSPKTKYCFQSWRYRPYFTSKDRDHDSFRQGEATHQFIAAAAK